MKLSSIRKTPGKNEWCVKAESGINMGCYNSKSEAEKRLRQIEMFKHMKKSSVICSIARRIAGIDR
jgi:hypothetical protein